MYIFLPIFYPIRHQHTRFISDIRLLHCQKLWKNKHALNATIGCLFLSSSYRLYILWINIVFFQRLNVFVKNLFPQDCIWFMKLFDTFVIILGNKKTQQKLPHIQGLDWIFDSSFYPYNSQIILCHLFDLLQYKSQFLESSTFL